MSWDGFDFWVTLKWRPNWRKSSFLKKVFLRYLSTSVSISTFFQSSNIQYSHNMPKKTGTLDWQLSIRVDKVSFPEKWLKWILLLKEINHCLNSAHAVMKIHILTALNLDFLFFHWPWEDLNFSSCFIDRKPCTQPNFNCLVRQKWKL